jgi:hypothetical protein
MSVQPHLFRDTPGSEPLDEARETHGTDHRPHQPLEQLEGMPLWLQRVSLFILVIFCLYLGVIVAVLPWWTAIWDRNSLFIAHPDLLAFLKLGVVRGVISGLGLLDIWIGVSEAVHYRESPRR